MLVGEGGLCIHDCICQTSKCLLQMHIPMNPFLNHLNQSNVDAQSCDSLTHIQCHVTVYMYVFSHRHPEAHERVTFHHLYQSLSQPEDYLLSWTDDEEESVSARQLGADHTHSQHLHTDLQTKYLSKTDARIE